MTSREHPTATITTPNSTPGQSGRFGSESVAAFRHKLDEPDLALGFDGLFAADVQGRARAWRSLAGQEASLDPETAARLVGLADDRR